jgi:hypothetical protein
MRSLLACLVCAVVIILPAQKLESPPPGSPPYLYWQYGIETADAVKAAGIKQIAVPEEMAEAWSAAGFAVVKVALDQREKTTVPGIVRRANIASPTTRPWIDANGWRFLRGGKFVYELPPGKAALAAAEAFAYRADAVLKIDREDLERLGKMLAFLRSLPQDDLPAVADIGVIDDGSPTIGEVMNLLSRRNLLYKIVAAPSPRFPITIKLGTNEYPEADAADPSAFAQKIRSRLTDEKRTLKIYGNEVVICRVTGDKLRLRLHLLNYSGRGIEVLRVRLLGKYGKARVKAFGYPESEPEEIVDTSDAIEFTVMKMDVYAMIELPRLR